MKVLNKTPRTRTIDVNGQIVKVVLRKSTSRIKGAPQLMESARVSKGTIWSVDALPDWFATSRKQMEAVLLAVDSGMDWDDAKNVKQIDWVCFDDPAIL